MNTSSENQNIESAPEETSSETTRAQDADRQEGQQAVGDDQKLFPRFRRLGGLLRHQAHAQHPGHRGPFGPAADPTQGQGRILAALKLRDGVPTKDLAFILDLRVPSLNELLGKLEKAGYITREPSAEDRRIVLIHLTAEGRAAEQLDPEQQQEQAFAVLDEQERARLGQYLDRIIEHLEESTEFPAPEREKFEKWAEKARERMGEDQFEDWMAAVQSRFGEGGPRGFGRGRRGFGGRGPGAGDERGGRHGFGGGPEGRGGFGGPQGGHGPQHGADPRFDGQEFDGQEFGGQGFGGPRGFGRPEFGGREAHQGLGGPRPQGFGGSPWSGERPGFGPQDGPAR